MTGDQTASFLEDLAAIARDPRTRARARHYAGDPELAEDALQEAFCTVAQARHPELIGNLRRYFDRAVIHAIDHLRTQAREFPPCQAEDIAAVAARQILLRLPPAAAGPGDFESEVLSLLQAEELLARLAKERHRLAASVPARSGDPGRYQASIAAAAAQIVRMLLEGPVTSGDWAAAIRSRYPEWYAGEDELRSTRRLRKAREDTRTLLKTLVRLDDAPGALALRPARFPQAPLHLAGPPDEDVRDRDDAVITALFARAEQTLLPQEVPYDLDLGLQAFTAWLGAVRQ